MVSAGGWAGEAFGRNRYREYKLLRDQDLGRGIKKNILQPLDPSCDPLLGSTVCTHVPHKPTPTNAGAEAIYSQPLPESKLLKGSSSADPRRKGEGRLQQENCFLTASHFSRFPLAAAGVSSQLHTWCHQGKCGSVLSMRQAGSVQIMTLLSTVLHYAHQINDLLPDFSKKGTWLTFCCIARGFRLTHTTKQITNPED